MDHAGDVLGSVPIAAERLGEPVDDRRVRDLDVADGRARDVGQDLGDLGQRDNLLADEVVGLAVVRRGVLEDLGGRKGHLVAAERSIALGRVGRAEDLRGVSTERLGVRRALPVPGATSCGATSA